MKTLIAAAIALLPLSALMTGAVAMSHCGARNQIIQSLGARFQENRQAIGLAGQSALIELYVSAQGTWTLTATNPAGLTCIVGAGDNWQSVPQKIAGLDS